MTQLSKPILDLTDSEYQIWRSLKLQRYSTVLSECQVEISNAHKLTNTEISQIKGIILNNNFAIYQLSRAEDSSEAGCLSFCAQLELTQSIPNLYSQPNNITIISESKAHHNSSTKSKYIPYSNQTLNWHTDGYYYSQEDQVRSFILHCRNAAKEGGINQLIDPEIAYIHLRDHNPQWAEALSVADCFVIPANLQDGKTIRDEYRGAVFSTDLSTGELYTRYTERKHNIQWRQNESTSKAIAYLKSVLVGQDSGVVTVKLEPGQGIICNNVLHNRTSFTDNNPNQARRCLYRIRFNDRIANSGS